MRGKQRRKAELRDQRSAESRAAQKAHDDAELRRRMNEAEGRTDAARARLIEISDRFITAAEVEAGRRRAEREAEQAHDLEKRWRAALNLVSRRFEQDFLSAFAAGGGCVIDGATTEAMADLWNNHDIKRPFGVDEKFEVRAKAKARNSA